MYDVPTLKLAEAKVTAFIHNRQMIEVLGGTICIRLSGMHLGQTVDICMGTNCALLLAALFHFSC